MLFGHAGATAVGVSIDDFYLTFQVLMLGCLLRRRKCGDSVRSCAHS